MSPPTSSSWPGVLTLGVLVLVSLLLVIRAARRTRTTADFLVAGHGVGTLANSLALAGDFIAAAGFLGIAGLIALRGADGMVFAIGGIIGWPMMLFLFAEEIRRRGQYTLGDVLAGEFGGRGVRLCMALNNLVIILAYLTVQLVGGGALLRLLFGWPYGLCVPLLGTVLMLYVLFGGMMAITWIQMAKATLVFALAFALLVVALSRFGFDPLVLLQRAVALHGNAVMVPGRTFGNPWEAISLGIALALGGASLPHLLMRLNTVASPRAARRSVFGATLMIVVFHFIVFLLGFSAMVLVGPAVIHAADAGGNMAMPLLARELGGAWLLAIVAAVSLATILAVVAGLTISGAAILSHDLWHHGIRRGNASHCEQMRIARLATVLITAAAVLLAVRLQGQNIGYLSAVVLAIAASANFPAVFLTLFWRSLSAAGTMAAMLVGLAASVTMIALSPLVQIGVLHHATAPIALQNPGIVCIPLAFAAAIVVSWFTRHSQRPQHRPSTESLTRISP